MSTTFAGNVGLPVAHVAPSVRAAFIRKTYAHLAGSVLLFIGLEYYLIQSPFAEPLLETMLGGKWSWAIVLGLFIVVSKIARWWASMDTAPAVQYLGLGLFIVAETIVFLPLLFIANAYYDGIIAQAGLMTLLLFAGLTLTVCVTWTDFSFLGPVLSIGGVVALGVILSSIAFGFELGLLFSALMVLFAAGSILYDTSNIMLHYRPTQHVAASLALFASVALLFWYILRILMKLNSRN